MERVIEPEWLDELPADDPRAVRSRGDLRRLNWLMNNPGIIARVLRNVPSPKRALDLGAGDGSFALRVASLLGWRNVEFLLFDRSASPTGSVFKGFDALNCTVTLLQRDVSSGFTSAENVDLIFTNLFLHHFKREQLGQLLGNVAAHCDFFVACEPQRSWFGLAGSRLLGLIACNKVTRHDAVASVRAGFCDRELEQHWPTDGDWSVEERAAGLFSHLFVARKL